MQNLKNPGQIVKRSYDGHSGELYLIQYENSGYALRFPRDAGPSEADEIIRVGIDAMVEAANPVIGSNDATSA